MSQNDQMGNHEEKQDKTPLELVQEQQAMKQEDLEVREQRAEPEADIPGRSTPSNIRKYPQRKTG